jgi:hypothetical protein
MNRLVILILATFLTSVPAAALPLQGALRPLIMRYELCAHSAPGTQEEIRARCAQERERVIKDSLPIIDNFYPNAKLDAKRWLNLALHDTDQMAARLARRNDPYGPAVLQYTACLADNALADPAYQQGESLYGKPIEKKCQPLYGELIANLGSGPAARKAKQRLWRLKSGFMGLNAMPVREPWIMVD